MSWASRRRLLYLLGVIAFFAIPIVIGLGTWLYEPATCFDGIQNQKETAIDKGGPCKLLDERRITPHSLLWTRTFIVRPGLQSAVAYIENPNLDAGVISAPYRIKIYDERNILVAEREGLTHIMPGTITPVFEGTIQTGDRSAVRAYLEFLAPLIWERLHDRSSSITVSDKITQNVEVSPRVSVVLKNTEVTDLKDVTVVAVVFDTAGNAFAASSTFVPLIVAGKEMPISFTWPVAFKRQVARVDVMPVVAPSD